MSTPKIESMTMSLITDAGESSTLNPMRNGTDTTLYRIRAPTCWQVAVLWWRGAAVLATNKDGESKVFGEKQANRT